MVRESVIVDAVRTPLARRGGALKDVHPSDLLAAVLGAVIERTGIDPAAVDDVICGCVGQIGEQSANIGRNAWLAAGLPEEVPATTVDRQCGSSQQAAHFAAQGVLAGAYDLVIACGVESMTRVPLGSNMAAGGSPFSPRLRSRYDDGLVSQGLSAEIVAERWGLSRAELDEIGFRSHERALAAQRRGAFAAEIVPVDAGGDGTVGPVTDDDGIREPDLEKMARLPPAFKADGVVTAGNSSQITDGAAALLVTTPDRAGSLGLRPRARFVSFALAGVDPVSMLTGPIPATRKVLDRAGLRLEDVDLVEINEAFASVVLAWRKELGVSSSWFEERVNVNGGAIALGHPLGASGARLLTTLLNALEQRDGRFGLVTMCEGGGLANATLIERLV